MICVLILSVGFSEVIGSWKIIAISLPRTSSSSRSESFVRSRPWNITEPSTIRAGGFGISPISDSAVTDFPHPDSPTIPRVFPASTVKLIPSTAFTTPWRVKNCVWRLSTSSRAISALSSRGYAGRERLACRPR